MSGREITPAVYDPATDSYRYSKDGRTSQPGLWVPQAVRLRAKGMTVGQIATQLGHAPSTISVYMPDSFMHLSNYDLRALRRCACPPEAVLRVVEEDRKRRQVHSRERSLRRALLRRPLACLPRCRSVERERDAAERFALRRFRTELQAAIYAVRERNAAELMLVARARRDWWDALYDARQRVLAQRREERQRAAAQRRYRWREIKPQRVSFDTESEQWKLADRLADPSALGQDPLAILTGTDHIAEDILGDLAIEDVARMDERQLEHLREKLLEAGVAPHSVQRAERERLMTPLPHHGSAPPPLAGKMRRGKSRTRKQRSESHKNRGRRFVREQKAPQDGWGGVVLPDEAAA